MMFGLVVLAILQRLVTSQNQTKVVTVDDCIKCVQGGGAWQHNECNKQGVCYEVNDAPMDCSKTEELCREWEEERGVSLLCGKKKTCIECVKAHDDCGWKITGEDHEHYCFEATAYWGAPEKVIRHTEPPNGLFMPETCSAIVPHCSAVAMVVMAVFSYML